MNTEQLSAFVTTADTGSFSAAARQLGKSMPTISQLVANLEIDLDLQLFDRSGRYPSLTDAGLELYDYAKYSLDSMADIQLKAQSLNAGIESNLLIGLESALYDTFVLPHLESFYNAFPGVHLRFIRQNSYALRKQVMESELDVAIGYLDSIAVPSQYESHSFTKDTMIPVVGKGHPLVGQNVSYGSLNQQLQLSFSLIDHIENSKHSKTLWLFEHPSRVKEVLLQDIGWAFMPIAWIEKELESGELVEIKFDYLHQRVYLEVELMLSKSRAQGPALRWWKQAILGS